MKKGYFNDVFKSLQKNTEKKSLGINFVTLKGYEYWIRMLRISKNYPDADDSIGKQRRRPHHACFNSPEIYAYSRGNC